MAGGQTKAISEESARARREGREIDRTVIDIDVTAQTGRLREVTDLFESRMRELPNLPGNDVLSGGKEANCVVRTWGSQPVLPTLVPHWELAERLKLVDFARGVNLSGSGFWIYTGHGAQLEWALINYFVAEAVKAGYTMLLPPHLVLPSAGLAAGQFPKFAEDVYHSTEANGLFLVPTAETALAGAYADEIFDETTLPFKAFAYTPCYRRERAGAHSDERGTVRGHQFNKVELFQFVKPEHAARAFQEMVAHVEGLVSGLGLHYQTSLLAASDMSAAMRQTYDVEVWMPSTGKYKEVSSVSWAGDYQARRAGIRFRSRTIKGTRYVHTLNGSALATSRIFPALLEQCQQPDGSVLIPEVLRPYCFNLGRIPPETAS